MLKFKLKKIFRPLNKKDMRKDMKQVKKDMKRQKKTNKIEKIKNIKLLNN